MSTEIKVPVLPESVADASVATWHVSVGDKVSRDQNLVDIETDKVVLEVVAQNDGVITEISQEEGATVLGDQVIGLVAMQMKHRQLKSQKKMTQHQINQKTCLRRNQHQHQKVKKWILKYLYFQNQLQMQQLLLACSTR